VAAVGHSALRQYSSATSRALSTVDKTADFWTRGAQTLTDRLPGLQQIDLIPAVERDFNFVQGTVGINRRLTIKWVGAAGTPSEMARDRPSRQVTSCDKAESAGEIVRERRRRPSGPPASRPTRSGHARPASPSAGRPGRLTTRPASATRA
jgi:hypothetical protein